MGDFILLSKVAGNLGGGGSRGHPALAARGSTMRMIVATVFLGTIGCQWDAETAGRSDTQMRDSADIRIVENARPPDGSRLVWQIGQLPAVSIGLLEGDDPYLLSAVTDRQYCLTGGSWW